MKPALPSLKPLRQLFLQLLSFALAVGMAAVSPRIAHAEDAWAVPRACAGEKPKNSSVSGSEMLDAALQAKWDIEDDIGGAERRASFSAGVVAGLGFQKNSTEWTKKVVVGPAATFRVHWGATLPNYLVVRSVQRVERLRDHTLLRLVKQSQQTADAAVEERKRLEDKRAELDQALKLVKEPAPPTDNPGRDDAKPAEPNATELASVMLREWTAQIEIAAARLSDACADHERVRELRKELDQLIESTNDKEGAFGGFEGMLGYGFDLLSEPIDPDLEDSFRDGHKPMPGIIGGIGANVPIKGLILSGGFMLHQQGLLGIYTGIGVPIFN